MAYKTGNPALNDKTFKNVAPVSAAHSMTLSGVAVKSIVLLVAAFAMGTLGWMLSYTHPDQAAALGGLSVLGAFGIALIAIFFKNSSPVTAPIYALLEGFALGVISQLYNLQYTGIVVQSLVLTLGIFLTMLMLYLSGVIKATENFKLGVAAATGGIAIYYLIDLGAHVFGFKGLPLIYSHGIGGIIFSVFVICLAAFNLVVDFDFIEQGVKNHAPKYMEWYASFGLFVTIVWLYLEILRLLGLSLIHI